MSDFQTALNDEMNKTSLPSNSPEKTVSSTRLFLQAFLATLVFSFFVISALFFWAWSKSKNTLNEIEQKRPSKIAIIEGLVPAEQNQSDNLSALDMMQQSDVTPIDVPPTTEQAQIDTPKAAASSGDQKTLSIIITDLGLSDSQLNSVLSDLPETVSIALSAYSPNLGQKIKQVQSKKHKAYVILPMETANYPLNDTGPYTLMTSMSAEKNIQRANQILALAKNADGFITQKDHKFNSEDQNINPALQKIFDEGFTIIDTNKNSFISKLNRDTGKTYNPIWLDDNFSNTDKLNQLNFNNSIIILAKPYPSSIKSIQEFLKSEKVKSFNIISPSKLIKND